MRLAIEVSAEGAIKSVTQLNSTLDTTPKVASNAGGALDRMKATFDSVAGRAVGVVAGLGAAHAGFELMASVARASVQALKDAAKSLGDYSDKIGTLSERTGLSISSLQVFNALAKTSGTDVDALAKAAVKMDYAMGLGDQSFQRLGLSIKELQAMSPDAAFTRVATAIGGLTDPMQKASAAMAIFGKAGAELVPVFSTNLEAARQQAEDFGLVLDEQTIRTSKALGDALVTTGQAFDSFLMRLAGVVANTPAVMQAVEGLSGAFGSMSKALDANAKTFQKWANVAAFALSELAADLATELGMMVSIAKYGSLGWAVQLTGVEKLTDGLKKMAQSMQDAVVAKMKWQATDMGGKGVLLPGHELGPQGGGGGGFMNLPDLVSGRGVANAAQKAAEDARKAWDDFFNHINLMGWKAGQSIIEGLAAGNKAAMPGLERSIMAGIPKALAVPFGDDGKVRRFSFDNSQSFAPIAKSSFTASQALQNLANIAQTSGSKLAKGLASIFGGGAGAVSGLSALFGSGKASFGTGLTAILGKAGMWGQIATSSISLFSGLFGLFKKKPKEPPPEPPKQATAQAWASFVGDQQSKGAAGVLAGVSGIKVTTPEDMAAQASIASQSFWAMFKEQGLIKAADAFKAVRDKMVETFKAAGADDSAIGAMIGPMSQVVDLAGNEAFRGAADGANGFAQALASIANQQLPMTVDQFHAFEQQAVAGYEQMKQAAIDQGMSLEEATKDAAIASGQYLTTLKDAATKYGFQLDGSKAIFEQATASGVSFGTSSMDRLILSVDALNETLGGAPPKFEQALSTAATQAGDRIGQAGGGIRGDKAIDITEDGVGASVAQSLTPGLEATAGAIVNAIGSLATAIASMPAPVIGDDAIANAAARAVNSGSPALGTALAGRG